MQNKQISVRRNILSFSGYFVLLTHTNFTGPQWVHSIRKIPENYQHSVDHTTS